MSKTAKQIEQNNAAEIPSPSIRTLKIATCPSLSGASRLTHHIGCDAKSGILFRITGNSGAGVFSNEWIALADIQQVFEPYHRAS